MLKPLKCKLVETFKQATKNKYQISNPEIDNQTSAEK